MSHQNIWRFVAYFPDTGKFVATANRGKTKEGDELGYLESNGYLKMIIERRKWWAHRLAWYYMTGATPEAVDHINGVRSDNRWCNLRAATVALNGQNIQTGKGESKVIGVAWDTKKGNWRAWIGLNGKFIHLGNHSYPKDAIAARIAAEQKMFTFAPTRDPEAMLATLLQTQGSRGTL